MTIRLENHERSSMDTKQQAVARITGTVIIVGPRAVVGTKGKHKCEVVI